MFKWLSRLMQDWRRILRRRSRLNEPIEEGFLRQQLGEWNWQIFSRQMFYGRVLGMIWNVSAILAALSIPALIWILVVGILPEQIHVDLFSPITTAFVAYVAFIVTMSLCSLRVITNTLVMALDATNPWMVTILSCTREP